MYVSYKAEKYFTYPEGIKKFGKTHDHEIMNFSNHFIFY